MTMSIQSTLDIHPNLAMEYLSHDLVYVEHVKLTPLDLQFDFFYRKDVHAGKC